MFSQYKDVIQNFGTYSKNVFRKDYFKWLITQMRGWSRFSWFLILANLIIQIIIAIQGFAQFGLLKTALGFIGSNLAVMTVCGISNRSPIQGWFGATSAIAIALNGLLARNWADATLQLVYLIFLDTFCILSPKWNENVSVHKMTSKLDWIKYIGFFFVAWILAILFYKMFNDPRIILDSATLAISLTGALMEFNLLREQFIVWTVSSIITLALWVQTARNGDASYALAAGYLVFLLNDLWAFFSVKGWFRGQARQESDNLIKQ